VAEKQEFYATLLYKSLTTRRAISQFAFYVHIMIAQIKHYASNCEGNKVVSSIKKAYGFVENPHIVEA
jgi:hypothetical protein